MIGTTNEEPELMENTNFCDETWIFQYDVETKQQFRDQKTPAHQE